MDDEKSIDRVLQGCYGAFLVTDFTAHFVKDREVNQGVSFIKMAVKNNLKHVVFSGLENVEKILKKPCLHFDYKAAVEDYGLKQADNLNFTSVRMPAFYQEIAGSLLYKASESEFYSTIPMDLDKKLYGMNVKDIGGVVASVLANPDKHKSQIIGLAGDCLKVGEFVEILNRNLAPITVRHPGGDKAREQFKTFKFPGVQDIINMFDYFNLEAMERDLALTKKLNPNVASFSDWVKKNRTSIREIKQ